MDQSTIAARVNNNTQDDFCKVSLSGGIVGIASDTFVHEEDEGDLQGNVGLGFSALTESSRSAFPYLDVVTGEGGGSEVEAVKTLKSIDMCGGSGRVGLLRGSGDYVYMKNYCKLIYCPDCTVEGGPIERLRMGRVFDRVRIDQENIRAFVFTVPLEAREAFFSRKGVNSLFKMVTKIMYGQFGKTSRMALVPHLVGDKTTVYAPHINVMIFEDKEVQLKLTKIKLEKINKAWRMALEGFTRVKIPIVNVHYEFKIELPSKLHLIRYNVRANFIYDEKTMMLISGKDFFRFQWLRFRGGLRLKGEKDMSDNEIDRNELNEQVGDEIIWIADNVSMRQLLAIFGGPGLGVDIVPGKFEIFREGVAARKKRGTKEVNWKVLK